MADPRSPQGPPPRPLWVKVSVIVALVAIAVIVVLAMAEGEHGPGVTYQEATVVVATRCLSSTVCRADG
jgi:hypothetical protein